MFFRLILITGLFFLTFGVIFFLVLLEEAVPPSKSWRPVWPSRTLWPVQSIDTMKYSRDLAREKQNDPTFDQVIDTQVKRIADTGATHVAIATPYDDEFILFLRRWVSAARRHRLNVWFRGNWAGWEGWFEYPPISREEHIQKTKTFIRTYPDIFRDGDIFSACPECENGGPGDPRFTGDVDGYRRFLVSEYQATRESFRSIKKRVASNYASMNGDVANMIMDQKTTRALDGVVTVDHYVARPEQLAQDVSGFAKTSQGKVVLGEWGTPIPDLNGSLTGDAQAQWIENALRRLSLSPDVIGVNYWLGTGSSTELWTSDGSARPGVAVLKRYYRPLIVSGWVKDEIDRPIEGARVSLSGKQVFTDASGFFAFQWFGVDPAPLKIFAPGFLQNTTTINTSSRTVSATLVRRNKNWRFKALQRVYALVNHQ